jgi:hypothetical protein
MSLNNSLSGPDCYSSRLQHTAHVHRLGESQDATEQYNMKGRMEGYCQVDWLWWEADETDLGSYSVVDFGIRSDEPSICTTSESIHPHIRIWDITVAKSVIYCLVYTHKHFKWRCTAIIGSTTRLVIHTVFSISQLPHDPYHQTII